MRSRFTTLRSRAKMLLKPRFGSRRCKGIWPPSKPLMRTPALAVWPLPPRPPVLPFPDPMPRPIRRRPWRAPALSEISLSFMACFLYGRPDDRGPALFCHQSSFIRRVFFDHADEMRDLGNHAPRRRRVLKLADAANAIKSEADEGLALVVAAPDRAAHLLDRYSLLPRRHGELRKLRHSVAAASASVSRRRACSDDTLTFRRAATARGESWRFKASKVARTML